jgi:Ca-activated chloride channel homolog
VLHSWSKRFNSPSRIFPSFIRAGLYQQHYLDFRIICLLGLLLLPAGRTLSQQTMQSFISAGTDEKTAGTLTINVNEVDLVFTVSDKHHGWVTNLSEDELQLRDNGEPPDSVRLFQSRKGLPLRLGLLIDTSDSVVSQFGFEKESAALFIKQMLDPAKDMAFVLGFNHEPMLRQDFTADREALASAVYKLHLAGSTAVYDAVEVGCRKMVEHDVQGPSRRVLVLLTDGEDNSSHLEPDQLIEDALRCNVTVIVLHTDPRPNEATPQYKVLKRLTSETGGRIFPAGDKKQMTKAFAQLSEQLRNYYFLAYHPAQFKLDGRYHKVELKTTRRKAHIICRRGYYAKGDPESAYPAAFAPLLSH